MKKYNITDLGYNEDLSEFRKQNNLESLAVGRVIMEHKERYVVLTEVGELDCELLGNLRYTAESRADFPAVGDWVAIQSYDADKGLIHAVYPRKNKLERQSVGRVAEKQIIASHVDFGFIVQSVNRDFSINRLERYITICQAANIQPTIVLNKVDLMDKERIEEMRDEIKGRIKGLTILSLSSVSGAGLNQLKSLIKPGKTHCFLGSSGVGKSTLINSLTGNALLKTGDISESVDRGKHVTTHRELIILKSGGILIDNPGMREVGMTDDSSGLERTFDEIYELAENCKFNDCSHQTEKGCAVLAALNSGELNEASYMNFMKMRREQAHFSATVHEKRRKEKAFGKMVKHFVGVKYKNH